MFYPVSLVKLFAGICENLLARSQVVTLSINYLDKLLGLQGTIKLINSFCVINYSFGWSAASLQYSEEYITTTTNKLCLTDNK